MSAPARWAVLGLLLGLVVAGLAVSAVIVLGRGVPGDRIGSLTDPPADAAGEREKVLAAGRTFVQRFNTYGPEMLEGDKMPEYAAVGDLMTSKFETVFDKNVGYAEATVAKSKIGRKATPYGVGLAALDSDSAEVLVAGTVEFSYPAPKEGEEPLTFEPVRFRYQVSLVKVGGEWLVDDLDDLDDQLPSFAEASIPGTDAPGGTPSEAPSGAPSGTPSGTPSDAASPGTEESQ